MTEDFVASFVPWLIFASVVSFASAVSSFCSWIIFWATILPKLWLLGSDHRPLSAIFADPTRRDFLAKEKPRFVKTWYGKEIDREPIQCKLVDDVLDRWFSKEDQTVEDPLQIHGNKEEILKRRYWRQAREQAVYPAVDRWRKSREQQSTFVASAAHAAEISGLHDWTRWIPCLHHVIFSLYAACLFGTAFLYFLGRIFWYQIGNIEIPSKHCLNRRRRRLKVARYQKKKKETKTRENTDYFPLILEP